jgi:hypothetical protein
MHKIEDGLLRIHSCAPTRPAILCQYSGLTRD